MIDGTTLFEFLNRRSWNWIIIRRKIGQTGWLFGTGEVDIKLQQDKLWGKIRWLFGTGEVDVGS